MTRQNQELCEQGNAQIPRLSSQHRVPFRLLDKNSTGAINNYFRSRKHNQTLKKEEVKQTLTIRRPRRSRTVFTKLQIAELEQQFQRAKYLSTIGLAELSKKLTIGQAQVKTWFKNRRRRHKLQSNTNMGPSSSLCTNHFPFSPLSSINTKDSQSSSNNNRTAKSNTQSLSDHKNNGTVVISVPTDTTKRRRGNIMDIYEDSYSYYNNDSINSATTPITFAPLTHAHVFPPSETARTLSVAQFCPPPHTAKALQQHQHSHKQQQSTYPNQHQKYEFQIKVQDAKVQNVGSSSGYTVTSKLNVDCRFKSPLKSYSNTDVDFATSTMITNSELCDSLRILNDENSSLSNDRNHVSGAGSKHNIVVSNEMNESCISTLQLLANNVDLCDDVLSLGCNFGGAVNIMEDCSSTHTFSKYNRLSIPNHGSNYNCTMDTITQSYNNNNHRHTSHNQQFAYC